MEYLWQWIGWNRDHTLICDCGTVWAADEKEAEYNARMCLGGPNMMKVKSVRVEKICAGPPRVYITRKNGGRDLEARP